MDTEVTDICPELGRRERYDYKRLFSIWIEVISFFIVFLSVSIGGILFSQGGVGEALGSRTEFVKLEETAEVKILLKYASSDNFMKENLYREFNFCMIAFVPGLFNTNFGKK